jgi:predicted membrane protein
MKEDNMTEKQGNDVHAGLGIGLVFIAAGLLLLIGNLGEGWSWGITFAQYWPSLLILVGIVKILHKRDFHHLFFGGVLVVVGSLFQLNNLGVISFWFGDLWPLAIIIVGLFIIMGSFRSPGQRWSHHGGVWCCGPIAGTEDVIGDRIELSRVFDGKEYSVTSKQFKGGKIDGVFGGIEIDFREAEIEGDSAKLEVSSVFGSIELRAPTRWRVHVNGTPVMGSIENKTAAMENAAKKLIIDASAVFGSVEIKN